MLLFAQYLVLLLGKQLLKELEINVVCVDHCFYLEEILGLWRLNCLWTQHLDFEGLELLIRDELLHFVIVVEHDALHRVLLDLVDLVFDLGIGNAQSQLLTIDQVLLTALNNKVNIPFFVDQIVLAEDDVVAGRDHPQLLYVDEPDIFLVFLLDGELLEVDAADVAESDDSLA
jgi:hypothetical protein